MSSQQQNSNLGSLSAQKVRRSLPKLSPRIEKLKQYQNILHNQFE